MAMVNLISLAKSLSGVRSNKAKNNTVLSFDLLYQLSYMSVVAASGAPRTHIFSAAAKTPCASSEYFRRIELASQKLRYDYAKACRIVGESTKDEQMKGLLLRFSSSLLSGEPEREFLTREAEAQAEAYDNMYARKLETLKMWTDAYVSLILSAVLITIIGTVSTMVWKIEVTFIVGLSTVSVLTAVLGVWLIHLMTPKEAYVIKKPGSNEQKQANKLFRLILPMTVMVAALGILAKTGIAMPLIVIGFMLLPIGYVMSRDDKKVSKRDAEVGSFLRSLGGVCSATGTTIKDALGRLDLDALYNLRHEVKRLNTRLLSGISTRLCWNKMVEESGSEVVNRSVGMFCDAIELGGEPEHAGYHSSLFSNKISMLRARRKTVSSPFQWLCIAMHASVVTLLVFITEVIGVFGGMVANTSASMPKITGGPSVGNFTSFNFSGLELMSNMVIPLVVVFTIANSLAPTIADGGSRLKILFNLGITAIISGLAMISLPKLADVLFSSIKM